MRKFIGVISLVMAILLMAMTLVVFAEQDSKPPSTEIEIVPDKGGGSTPVPTPAPASKYTPNAESGNDQPFQNLMDPVAQPIKQPPPTSPPTPPPATTTSGGDTSTTTPKAPAVTGPSITPVSNVKDKNPAASVFKFTGVLWNGHEYVGILTTTKNSYIVRAGDEIEEGYRVLNVSDKEAILVKEGQKSTITLQEVAK